MTEDKFEFARAAIAEFERTQRASELFAEEHVWDFSGWEGWIEDDEYVGRAAFDAQMARWTAPFESWSWELSELIDAGGDDILAVGVQRGVFEGSNTAVQMPIALIWTIRDGRLRRTQMFREYEHAYRAAGLAPPGAQPPADPKPAPSDSDSAAAERQP